MCACFSVYMCSEIAVYIFADKLIIRKLLLILTITALFSIRSHHTLEATERRFLTYSLAILSTAGSIKYPAMLTPIRH